MKSGRESIGVDDRDHEHGRELERVGELEPGR